jgi:hypothetical protein
MNSQKFTLEPLFAGFIGTTGLSDFSGSFIAVLPLSGLRRGHERWGACPPSPVSNRRSPGFRYEVSFLRRGGSASLVRCFGACHGRQSLPLGSATPRDPADPRDGGSAGVAFHATSPRQHPGQ